MTDNSLYSYSVGDAELISHNGEEFSIYGLTVANTNVGSASQNSTEHTRTYAYTGKYKVSKLRVGNVVYIPFKEKMSRRPYRVEQISYQKSPEEQGSQFIGVFEPFDDSYRLHIQGFVQEDHRGPVKEITQIAQIPVGIIDDVYDMDYSEFLAELNSSTFEEQSELLSENNVSVGEIPEVATILLYMDTTIAEMLDIRPPDLVYHLL